MYNARIFHFAINASLPGDKDKLKKFLSALAAKVNSHPERMLSRFPESNLVHVDNNICICEKEYKVNEIVGFGGAIQVLKFHHKGNIDRSFGRNNRELMELYFKEESLTADQVRFLGASIRYAKKTELGQLQASGGKTTTSSNEVSP